MTASWCEVCSGRCPSGRSTCVRCEAHVLAKKERAHLLGAIVEYVDGQAVVVRKADGTKVMLFAMRDEEGIGPGVLEVAEVAP